MNIPKLTQIAFFSIAILGGYLILTTSIKSDGDGILITIFGLFIMYHLVKLAVQLIRKKYQSAKTSNISVLLFVLLLLKLDYVYYNFYVSSTILLLIIIWAFRTHNNVKAFIKEQKLITTLLLLNIGLLFISDTSILIYINHNTIAWKPDLSWSDFRDEPSKMMKYTSAISDQFCYKINRAYHYPQAIIYAQMLPDRSYVRKGDGKDEYYESLLMHEQTHFDITELHVRQVIDSLNKERWQVSRKIGMIISYADRRNWKMQRDYDNQTMHGMDSTAQIIWTQRINNVLSKTLPNNVYK